jgi:hypothetical protein
MADNTVCAAYAGGDVIATDDLTRLNGGVVSGVKAERMKLGFGVSGVYRGVSGLHPLPISFHGNRNFTYEGRTSTFRIPGRGGNGQAASGDQPLFSIFNASGSSVLVDITNMVVSRVDTATSATYTIVRFIKTTSASTGGNTTTKVSKDRGQTSSASVTVLQDASADGTSSATALAATIAYTNAQDIIFPDILYSGANMVSCNLFETYNKGRTPITLQPSEGLVAVVTWTTADANNSASANWLVSCDWTEYTLVS